MPKIFYAIISLFVSIFILSGCSSNKNVKFRGYVEDRPRVDQEISGNSGYLYGDTTAQVDPSRKTTRKVVVMEFSKEAMDADAVFRQEQEVTRAAAYTEPVDGQTTDAAQDYKPLNIPRIDDESVSGSQPSLSSQGEGLVDYKVEKDDTLQKISKKFYNSSGQWVKIYEANRDIIGNPDRIQPGIVLKIPVQN